MRGRSSQILLLGMFYLGLALAVSTRPGHAAEQMPHRGQTPAIGEVARHPGSGWCADHRLGRLNERQRLAGDNLKRLRAAQAELAPGFASGGAITGLRLLAAYQEELEKSRPDVLLAASYLAQASAVPITAGRLRRVNALLCVSAARSLARKITTEAEDQRRRLAR